MEAHSFSKSQVFSPKGQSESTITSLLKTEFLQKSTTDVATAKENLTSALKQADAVLQGATHTAESSAGLIQAMNRGRLLLDKVDVTVGELETATDATFLTQIKKLTVCVILHTFSKFLIFYLVKSL